MANLKKMNEQMKVYKINQAWNALPKEIRNAAKYAVFVRKERPNAYSCHNFYHDVETAKTIAVWLREIGFHCADVCVYLENSKRYMPISF